MPGRNPESAVSICELKDRSAIGIVTMISIMVFVITLVVVLVESDDAEAWDTWNARGQYDVGKAGYMYYTTKYETQQPRVSWGHYTYEERAWMAFDTKDFYDDAYIGGGTLRISGR